MSKFLETILSKLSLSPATEPSFLSDLKLESYLGHGAFGIVLKAVNSKSDPLVATAVKLIFVSESNQKEILRESTLAKELDHGNIVKILNVTGKLFTASELESKVLKTMSKDDRKALSLIDGYIAEAKRYKTVEAICIQMELCGESLRKWLNNQNQDSSSPDKLRSIQFRICRGVH